VLDQFLAYSNQRERLRRDLVAFLELLQQVLSQDARAASASVCR